MKTSLLEGVEKCGLHKKTPYGIQGVSTSMLSVARYSGGCKYNGDSYVYIPHTDELVREDVLKWINKQKASK